MAAYAALVSLMNLIEQIQHHPRPPFKLDMAQAQSLTDNNVFLKDFLEAYNFHDENQVVERLRSRIADAAHAAEDVIEFQVVDKILSQYTSHDGEKIGPIDLYPRLQKVIEGMDFIKKEVMEITGKMGIQNQLQRTVTTPVVSSESPTPEQNTMVGFDNVLYEVLDELTSQQSHRQIIAISGMGGIGKTTLAKNIYTNPLIEQRFDICAWVTISQVYNIREILLEVLLCQKSQRGNENLSEESDESEEVPIKDKSDEDLGLELYQSLCGRRYLIIMDDMWIVDVWNKVKFFFPDNNNGSRIIVTTRISKLALDLGGTAGLKMSFLDWDKSWDLLCKVVFGEQRCPHELEHIGRRIAKNCKGLPLSIVVIGGLLAKSKQTREYWKYIAENLNSVVNLEDNERCLKILHTSYNQLPIHLKPCLLYMGSFPEDSKIGISRLIKQWVAEGFLNRSRAKSWEETAEEYLMDLTERNLISIHTYERREKLVKCCNIHDLLRDLCLREAKKEKFLYITRQGSLDIFPHDISTQRRIAILESTSKEELSHPQVPHAWESPSLARSLISHFEGGLPSLGFRLLRILKVVGAKEGSYPIVDVCQLVNSRYLDITSCWGPSYTLCSSLYLFWNLQTLILKKMFFRTIAPPEFWVMPLLRHVQVDELYLPNPPIFKRQEKFVMDNLQTLSTIHDFKLNKEVVERIPNIKKLKISYQDFEEGFEVASHYNLNNLDRLHKLEHLSCTFHLVKQNGFDFRNNMKFPTSLKILTLCSCRLDWGDVNTKIGSLPLLQALKLLYSHFTQPKWETIEGNFTSLKYLQINFCHGLEYWTTENTHFPRLENLSLGGLANLKEIPSDIGEIPTMKTIRLHYCSAEVVISAKRILEEQEELGNEDLQVRVAVSSKSELMELQGRNFYVNAGL